MFKPEDIEELRNYFQPIPLSGESLPNIKDVADFQNFILKNADGTNDLYLAFEGGWSLVKSDIGG